MFWARIQSGVGHTSEFTGEIVWFAGRARHRETGLTRINHPWQVDLFGSTVVTKETQFIKLFVASERKFLGYLITLLPRVEDAEELLQETSIVIWEKFDEFLATQEGEPNVDRFVAWGCKVAFYKVLNHRRKRRSTAKQLSDEVIEVISSVWLERQESSDLGDRRTALKRCLEKLPARKRDILHDYYWHKENVKEIASRNQQTIASVYKLLQRIRSSLHKCIEQRLAQS